MLDKSSPNLKFVFNDNYIESNTIYGISGNSYSPLNLLNDDNFVGYNYVKEECREDFNEYEENVIYS
jgi:hypothetical protein